MPTPNPKITIWLWPTGLFPRRVLYYLRAKHITLSALTAQNIHLIPVLLDTAAWKLEAKEGYESRPEGMSLPCMRIEHVKGGGVEYVHETESIVRYLEEVFRGKDAENGCGDIMGSTASQRARTHDIVSVVSEASVWSSVALMHSDTRTLSWSGLDASSMSASAAADARKRSHRLLSKVETWVEADVVEKKTESLSGEGGAVTLADVVLMSNIAYMEDSYGKDFVEEHGVLRLWYDRAREYGWVVGLDRLKECEESGWSAVL